MLTKIHFKSFDAVMTVIQYLFEGMLLLVARTIVWTQTGEAVDNYADAALGLDQFWNQFITNELKGEKRQPIISDKIFIVVMCQVVFFKMHSYFLTNMELRKSYHECQIRFNP